MSTIKPQCKTPADCLDQLARVMRQFNFTDINKAVRSDYIQFQGNQWPEIIANLPAFNSPELWNFAVAELEGKPVFIGDELYYQHTKMKVFSEPREGWKSLSWNPPKPKTVMIELLVEDAERWANHPTKDVIAIACRKALENLK